MKAAWYEKTGSAAAVLRVGEMSDPYPKAGEVLVNVKASGVNPSDVKIRAGARGDLQYPMVIPHSDGGGIIIDVGEGVSSDRIGEHVWIWNGAFERAFGTCAELIALPAEQAVKMSQDTSFEAAACMGIPASTAYYGIFANGSVEGQTVMVNGGAGAVGYYGIQLAKWSGANVISTVSCDEKAKIAKNAGADLVLNYKKDDVIGAVSDFTEGVGVDRILEVEFGSNLPVNERIIKNNGTIAAYASAGIMEPVLPFYNLMFKGIKIDTFIIYTISEINRKNIINGICSALNNNILSHMIAKSFAINDIIDAHESMESGSIVGNIIISL
jgi:NADPH2:quinone reductase